MCTSLHPSGPLRFSKEIELLITKKSGTFGVWNLHYLGIETPSLKDDSIAQANLLSLS